MSCPTITISGTLANGTVGTSYSQTLTASGGTSPYTFTLSSGTLPTGLNLSAGGAVSGTPTVAGTFTFTVKATDAHSCTRTQTYTVNIVPATPTASNNGPICAGSALNLTASTVSGATYSWTGPNGFTSALQNPSILHATTAPSGTYSVTV